MEIAEPYLSKTSFNFVSTEFKKTFFGNEEGTVAFLNSFRYEAREEIKYLARIVEKIGACPQARSHVVPFGVRAFEHIVPKWSDNVLSYPKLRIVVVGGSTVYDKITRDDRW